MMVHQDGGANSPQWFNTGLNWAYGLTGPAQGHHVPDPKTGEVTLANDAYTHPQPHACFIQSVGDDLVAEGGIMDLWVREARLFKYGSGTGTNFRTCGPRVKTLRRRQVLRLDVLAQDRRPRAASRHQVRRNDHAPRRWFASTWTTPTSRTS